VPTIAVLSWRASSPASQRRAVDEPSPASWPCCPDDRRVPVVPVVVPEPEAGSVGRSSARWVEATVPPGMASRRRSVPVRRCPASDPIVPALGGTSASRIRFSGSGCGAAEPDRRRISEGQRGQSAQEDNCGSERREQAVSCITTPVFTKFRQGSVTSRTRATSEVAQLADRLRQTLLLAGNPLSRACDSSRPEALRPRLAAGLPLRCEAS